MQEKDVLTKKKEIEQKYTLHSKKEKQGENNCYRWIILKGNNDKVVARVVAMRPWWQKIPHTITLFDFKWTPHSSQIKFDFLGKHGEKNLVNHFEHHGCMTQKDQLALNMIKTGEAMQKNVFESLPLTFVIDNTERL